MNPQGVGEKHLPVEHLSVETLKCKLQCQYHHMVWESKMVPSNCELAQLDWRRAGRKVSAEAAWGQRGETVQRIRNGRVKSRMSTTCW